VAGEFNAQVAAAMSASQLRVVWSTLRQQVGAFTSFIDLAQRVGASQLGEQHRHELVPTRKPARMPLGLRGLHRAQEFGARK
jgi:hypothetical protein